MIELSDEELSRWIAEKLGYRVASKRSKNKVYPKMYQFQRNGKHADRSTGFFGWGWHHDPKSAWFYSPDFIDNAEWTLTLIELLREHDTIDIQLDAGKTHMGIDGLPGGILYFVKGQSIGRAVAEAFALANGWAE